jgi:hypothetical protein
MPHAIIRGANGRRHEVEFGNTPVRIEIYASEETVEIFIRADSRNAPTGASALRLSTFPAACLAKPLPQRLDVPRTPSCILGVTSDVGTRAEFKSARFLVLVNPWHDLLAAASPGVSRPSRTPTGPLKHPHAFPKRDSGNDGTMHRPVATVEARRSRS